MSHNINEGYGNKKSNSLCSGTCSGRRWYPQPDNSSASAETGRPNPVRYMLVCCVVSVILPIFTGCAGEQRSAQLYVDAVMHKELGENEKAIEKLSRRVAL